MSRSPSISFGPEWMRSSNNATSKKPDENKSPVGWASVAAGGGSSAHNLSTPIPTATAASLLPSSSSSSIPSFAAIAGNGSHESKLFPKEEPKLLPVVTNEGGKKYTPDEMIEIWKEMDHSTQTRSMGRARSELYYSALANDPLTFAVKEKPLDKVDDDEDDPIALSNSAVAESLQSLGGEPVGFGGISRTSTVASSGWNAFAPLSQHSSTTDLTGLIAAAATPPPPPPGISLLPPESVNWMYKDPTDKEYGPFTGNMMHEWYMGGWLHETLLIRRREEQEYISLKTFRERVSNQLEPFLVPLPPVGGPPGLDFVGKPGDPFPRLRTTPLATQFSGLQLQNSWLAQTPSSPWTPQQPLSHTPLYQPTPHSQSQQQQQGYFGNIDSQPIAEAVWGGAATSTAPNVNNIPQTYAPRSAAVAPIQAQPEVVEDVAADVVAPATSYSPNIVQEEVKTEEEQQKQQEPTPVPASPPVPVSVEHAVPESPVTVSLEHIRATEPSVPEVPEVEPLQFNNDESEPSMEEKKAALAPWAKNVVAAPVKKASAPSLREIQEREAAERKAKLSQRQQQNQASILQQAAAISSAAARSSAPALPSGANWANSVSASASTPQKTLAQIQQEEAASAASKAKPAAPTIASAVKSSNPPGISAPTAATSSPSGGSAWTTVGPAGRKTGLAAAAAPAVKPIVTAAPVIKRAVSAAALANDSPKSSSDDFLTWCKGAITDLKPGVNQTEMLSMLVELPASTDSKEIIADIIYANSSTMDGRRFAEEFLKRKKQADSEPQAASSWSEALQRQAQTKNENDGWNASFKVVTKKKNRRA